MALVDLPMGDGIFMPGRFRHCADRPAGERQQRRAANQQQDTGDAVAKPANCNAQLVEERLQAVPSFAGDAFTAADIMMAYPFTTLRRICPIDLSPCPAIRDYVARLETRPGFQKATRRHAEKQR